MRSRVGLRSRLQLSVTGGVALALAVLIGAFNVVLRDRLNSDANNMAVTRATTELSTLQVRGSRLITPEAPDAGALDAQTWVFSGTRAIEAPRSDPVAERAAEFDEHRTTRLRGRRFQPALFRARAVVGAAPRRTSSPRSRWRPIETRRGTALVASLLLGGVILAVVAIAARLLIAGALRPVAQMTKQAATWSEVDTRPALRPRNPTRRARHNSPRRSTHCSITSPPACATSSSSRRSSHTSSAHRWPV